MVMPPATKPKPPMGFAPRARIPVRVGKLRLGSRIPAVWDHYQLLPPPDKIHMDMKPIDYIGLYILVTVASCITVNWLYRIYL